MENAEIQTEENQETSTEPQKRNRRKSIRRRLDERLQQLDSLSRNPELKPTKQAETAIEATAIEKMLFQAEREDRKDESLQENERLKVQHDQDTAKIAELESRLETRSTQTVITPDPETPKLTAKVKELTTLIAFVASEMPDVHTKACTAIRAILKYGTASRVLVESLGCDLHFYYQGLQSNPTAEDLRDSLSRCPDPDGIPAVYARAALEVLHGMKVPKPVRRICNSDTRDYASLALDEFND